MAREFRRMGDDAGAYRHQQHGESISVCADEKYLHKLRISIQTCGNKSKMCYCSALISNAICHIWQLC